MPPGCLTAPTCKLQTSLNAEQMKTGNRQAHISIRPHVGIVAFVMSGHKICPSGSVTAYITQKTVEINNLV
jgi:hypothetical protein